MRKVNSRTIRNEIQNDGVAQPEKYFRLLNPIDDVIGGSVVVSHATLATLKVTAM